MDDPMLIKYPYSSRILRILQEKDYVTDSKKIILMLRQQKDYPTGSMVQW